MAKTIGAGFESVARFAEQSSRSLEFFQLIRLLVIAMRQDLAEEGHSADVLGDWDSLFRSYIRVRPRLSLAFPESDLHSVKLTHDRLLIETNFFGLYGVTSPLPHFYTEDLMDAEQNGYHSLRGFIDIFHYAAYPLLVKAWTKNRLATGLGLLSQSRHVLRDTSWLGLMDPQFRLKFDQWRKMLPLAPVLSGKTRSASGLQFLIARIIEQGKVFVQPCSAVRLRIPVVHHLQLGTKNHQLGHSALVGDLIDDRSNNVLVVLTDVPTSVARSIVPGGSRFKLLQQSVSLFLRSSLRVTIRVHASPERSIVGSCRLGFGAGLAGNKQKDSFSFHLIR